MKGVFRKAKFKFANHCSERSQEYFKANKTYRDLPRIYEVGCNIWAGRSLLARWVIRK